MLLIWLLALLITFSHSANAQSCNPASVSYIVRDEGGNVVDEADIQSIVDKLPKKVGDATVFVDQVSFAADGVHYFWPESVDFPKGNKQSALGLANAGTCTLHLTEVSLTYHDKKMRLIFNIDIARVQRDRRLVVDSLPFEEGTFALDMTGWTHDEDKLISADRWKRVKQ